MSDDGGPLWIFAYGSLLWRPGFPFERRSAAFLEGWERRLDQGSPDHRGTPEKLGRVATLVRADGRRCGGAVYRVADPDRAEILVALDHRERGGYDRVEVDAILADPPGERVRAVVWVASPDNPYHLGPAPLDEMVRQIQTAVGPSGANVEYVLRLAETLRALGVHDPLVAAVAALL
jgi:glutathione-specific gamma-glutamylcyclotransferase